MADYRKLEVWQAAKQLAVLVYRECEALPSSEQWNLRSQLERASVSVVANIAEGAGRGTPLDFARFVRISLGSLSELSALLELAHELHAVSSTHFEQPIRDLQVRLSNLLRKLESDAGRVRESTRDYDPSEPSSAIVCDRSQL